MKTFWKLSATVYIHYFFINDIFIQQSYNILYFLLKTDAVLFQLSIHGRILGGGKKIIMVSTKNIKQY